MNVVVYNLQVQVPGMPGWFVKMGRDNGFLPRGIIADVPTFRDFGIQIWGGSMPGLGLKPRFEAWKRDETPQGENFNNGLALNDDDDLYVVKLPFSPMKGLRVMPYLVYWSSSDRPYTFGSNNADVDMFYPAVSISMRQGNSSGSSTSCTSRVRWTTRHPTEKTMTRRRMCSGPRSAVPGVRSRRP